MMKGMNALLRKPHYSWGGHANSIAFHMPLLERCGLEAKLGVNDHRYDEVP